MTESVGGFLFVIPSEPKHREATRNQGEAMFAECWRLLGSH
jgi:hypothetical protein